MPRHPVQALLNQARYLVLIAVAGLTVLSVATFAWAIAKTVKLFGALLDGGWRGDVALVDLLGVIEMYLLAIVQLIVVYFTGSVALMADTIHNFSDALTAVPLWIAFVLARR